MIYIELENGKPIKSTSNPKIAEMYTNCITTDYEDYNVNNNKYKFDNGIIVLNPYYEQEKAQQAAEYKVQSIKSELYELDLKAIRPLRAILAGTQTDDDIAKIKELEAQAAQLRSEM